MSRSRMMLAIAASLVVSAAVLGSGLALIANARGNEPRTAPEYIASIATQLPPAQHAALADGIVTFEEQEEATARTIACMRDGGLVVEPIPARGLLPTRIGVRNDPSAVPADEATRIGQACRDEFLGEINFVWANQRPDASQLATARLFLEKCLEPAGLQLPSAGNPTELGAAGRLLTDPSLSFEAASVVMECFDDTLANYGTLP